MTGSGLHDLALARTAQAIRSIHSQASPELRRQINAALHAYCEGDLAASRAALQLLQQVARPDAPEAWPRLNAHLEYLAALLDDQAGGRTPEVLAT